MAGVLTKGKGFYTPLVYTLECRRLGIGFLSPDVNVPSDGFTVERSSVDHGTPAPPLSKAIRMPLRCIKEISEGTLARWRSKTCPRTFRECAGFLRACSPRRG
ncbi:MAG: DNA-directed polymerase [Prosthecobacter sp.]|nr:DNA-directed polymerase [Prosthecobacter sp.]